MQRNAPQPAKAHVVDPRLTHYSNGGTVFGLTTEHGIFRVSVRPSYETIKVKELFAHASRMQPERCVAGISASSGYSSSSKGTMVDFTVCMAMAWATASLTPAVVKGNSVCMRRQG